MTTDTTSLLDGCLMEQPFQARDYPRSPDVMRHTAIRWYLTGT